MTKLKHSYQVCAVALAMGFSGVAVAADAPAGQLLFVSGLVKIMDANGVERAAKKGDKIGPGEHLVTGGGAIGQIKLSDGSLIGVRPESDLKLENMKPGDGQGPDERMMFLSKGAVRIVNVENNDNKKLLPVLLQTPTATIGLRNADNESIVVPAPLTGGDKPAIDPGTYSRMAVGGGVIKTAGGESSLVINQATFAPTGSAALPTKIALMPDTAIKTVPLVSTGITLVPSSSSARPDKIEVPAPGLTKEGPLPATIVPTVKLLPSLSTPVVIAPVSPIVIQPIKPQTLVNTGAIDVSTVSTSKLATLPPSTLAELPTATLAKLPPSTLATLPTATIKSLPDSVQTTVMPLLTTARQTELTTVVPTQVKTSNSVPITPTNQIKTSIVLTPTATTIPTTTTKTVLPTTTPTTTTPPPTTPTTTTKTILPTIPTTVTKTTLLK